MALFLILLFLFCTFQQKVIAADTSNIPMYYQLLEAYRPASPYYYLKISPTPTTISPKTTPITTKAAPTQAFSPISSYSPRLNLSASAPSINSLNGQILGTQSRLMTVAVLGDSMTNALGDNIPGLEAALKRYYPEYQFRILNYGSESSNIENGFYRLTNDHEILGKKYTSVIAQKPDIIIVESFAYNNFGNTQAGIDRHWTNLSAITATIAQDSPTSKIIIAVTISPNSNIFADESLDKLTLGEKIERSNTVKLYLQNTVNFAKTQNYPLADVFSASMKNGEGISDFISESDHIRPSALGIQLFCETLAKTVFDYRLI
jgi:hypothetical protein